MKCMPSNSAIIIFTKKHNEDMIISLSLLNLIMSYAGLALLIASIENYSTFTTFTSKIKIAIHI
jgi:hypothetical protein